jgi:hypothetical protein
MRFEEYRQHDAVSLAGLIAKRQVSAEEVLRSDGPNRSIQPSMPSCTSLQAERVGELKAAKSTLSAGHGL